MVEVPKDEKTIFNNNENHCSVYDNISIEENNEPSKQASNILNSSNLDNSNIPEPNCLALTVRKDYNLIIVKNIFTASGRLSWKIVLATVVLNFLNFLF